ncbi:unnamed protein product [Agarophyton chilense]
MLLAFRAASPRLRAVAPLAALLLAQMALLHSQRRRVAHLASPVPLASPSSPQRVYSPARLPNFDARCECAPLFPPQLGDARAAHRLLLDVGANNGDAYTLAAFRRGHPVLAFEPSPVVARHFRRVLRRAAVPVVEHTPSSLASPPSNHSRVVVHFFPLALSNFTGHLPFYQSPCADIARCGKNNRLQHVRPHDARPINRSVVVPVFRLDDVPLPLRAPPPWLLKVDVEGHELRVLQGAVRLISRTRLPYITLEFSPHARRGLQWALQLLRFLHHLQYQCHHLRGFGSCHLPHIRSPSVRCNFPFPLYRHHAAPTFEQYVRAFDAANHPPNKPPFADLMCVRRPHPSV